MPDTWGGRKSSERAPFVNLPAWPTSLPGIYVGSARTFSRGLH